MSSAIRISGTPPGPGSFAVASATTPGLNWTVEWQASGVRWCGCPSFARKETCRHVEEVGEAIRQEGGDVLAHLTPEQRRDAAARLAQIEELLTR